MRIPLRGRDPRAISPTAHFTAYVWARNGLGAPVLATRTGRGLHLLVDAITLPYRLVGGPTLDGFLLARHRIIDRLLTEAITTGQVTQVVELAAGLSPRGQTFTATHPGLTYVEVDLPGMTAYKQAALERSGPLAPGHRVEGADVIADADALTRIVDGFDRAHGVAFITEGLLNYFPTPAVEQLWARIADAASGFAHGLYLSDVHLATSAEGGVDRVLQRAFIAALSVFVRGQVHLHYDSEADAVAALRDAGFASAHLHAARDYADELPDMTAPGAGLVHVIEAHR